MVVPFRTIIETEGFMEMTVRTQRDIGRKVHGAIAKHWRDNMLAGHFRQGASTRYRYKRRKATTIKRKRLGAARGKVEAGGRLPLVHSGRLRRNMRALHRINATPRRSTVRLIGPQYFQRRSRGSRPNLAKEVLAVDNRDQRDLERVGGDSMEHEIRNAPKRRRRRTIKPR